MGITIYTAEDCASNYGNFKVTGSKGETYHVSFNGSEQQAFCTCDSFKYSKVGQYGKECKHLKYVWDHACMYNPQWKDAVANPELRPYSYNYDRFSGNSCECGGPLVWVKRAA